jgi:molybdopterin molybdotransferase
MLSVKEAQEQINSHFKPVETTFVPLDQSAGRILTEALCASADQPAFDNSSVDGFAIRVQDILSASQNNPVSLRVVADIPAGSMAQISLAAGQAARIMTGAATPPGADAIVMMEDTDANQQVSGANAPANVNVFKSGLSGQNIRRRAADISIGQEILPAGVILRPQDIGMLAMLGVSRVAVRRKPKIVIVSGGNELLQPGAPLEPGKIYDSNSYTLAALAANSGCEARRLGVALDSYEAVHNLLAQAAEAQPDLIISSAGVSVGAFDYVRDVVESDGNIDFWKVNMRPGKPLAFGSFRDIPFFGLPGNPVSSFVSFLLFVQPALERLLGLESGQKKRLRVTLMDAIESDGRESYLRAIIKLENGKYLATLTGHQGSGNLYSLVQANALLIIPSGVKSCPPGSEVEAWSLENN